MVKSEKNNYRMLLALLSMVNHLDRSGTLTHSYSFDIIDCYISSV